jgi:phosphoribosylaminoimidazole-succinocarboxamide synthase
MDIPAIPTTDFTFPGQTDVYHGKVRDIYYLGEHRLLLVATDRVSAFDVILPRPIPSKGQVLNRLAAHFLERTADIVPNWLQAVPDPNVSAGVRAEPVKVEVVVRGALVGHAWREYDGGKRKLCGVKLPDGMKEYDAFEEPIITPTTKAAAGHDEDIDEAAILKQRLATADEWDKIKDYARQLFARGQDMAAQRGLVLADTKYEFGRLASGEIILIDEVHTPDSSRYFYTDSYNAFVSGTSDKPPKHLSKEFLRQWLLDRGFDGQGEPPAMDDAFVRSVSARYIELYETMTGKPFDKNGAAEGGKPVDPLKRIEANVLHYIQENRA